MASLIAEGKQQYFSNAGTPLVGGKLYTYSAGTTAPKATYTDADGTNLNTNPIILDARGEATVFWSGSYKVILKDASDNVIWTIDKVTETNLGYRTSSNGSAITPQGTTAQRDAVPVSGYFRYNLDFNCFEGYYAASWRSFVQSINGTVIPNGGDVLLKTVGGTSIIGAGDITVQAPLVSGVNIKTIAGVTILGPGNISLVSTIVQSSRTANVILGAADAGTFIDITANTFTQTFTAAATLGTGWWCWFRNSGTGDITLDPNGAELIDGLTSYVMYPGECRLIQCTAAAFTTFVVTPFTKTFTSSTTFTKPPGYQTFDIYASGGGGGGGSGGSFPWGTYGNYVSGGGGGGGGGIIVLSVPATAMGATATITIGAGGTGGPATVGPSPGTAGGVGGATSFGTFALAAGGNGGGAGALGSTPSPAGTPGGVYPVGNLQSSLGGAGGRGDNGSAGVGNPGSSIGNGVATGPAVVTTGGAGGAANSGGTTGSAIPTSLLAVGSGGGGASADVNPAGTGGSSVKGAGGGGGGGSSGTGNGGAGGTGGAGFCVITGK